VSDGGATFPDLAQLMTLLMNRPTAINSFSTKIIQFLKKIKINFVKLSGLFFFKFYYFFKSRNNLIKLTKFNLKNGNNFLIY